MDGEVLLSSVKFTKWKRVPRYGDWFPDKCLISDEGYFVVSQDIPRLAFLFDMRSRRVCVLCRYVRFSAWCLVPNGPAGVDDILLCNYHSNNPQLRSVDALRIVVNVVNDNNSRGRKWWKSLTITVAPQRRM
jgi:hypothetical protein